MSENNKKNKNLNLVLSIICIISLAVAGIAGYKYYTTNNSLNTEISNLNEQIKAQDIEKSNLLTQLEIKENESIVNIQKIDAIIEYQKYYQNVEYEEVDSENAYERLSNCLSYANNIEKQFLDYSRDEEKELEMFNKINNENDISCEDNINDFELLLGELKEEREEIVVLTRNLCEGLFDDSVTQNDFERNYETPFIALAEEVDEIEKDYTKKFSETYISCLE
ncbi:MAG: hypothetical protein ACLFPL_03655 [Candidatus Nanoarchaeia archaeon]